MALKLHGMAASTCTSRVLATLYEKAADNEFELVLVNLYTGDQKKPEHLKLQPFGVVPALVDGSLTVFESRAISRYLDSKFENQGTALFGHTPAEKALVDTWFEVEAQNFHPAISVVVSQLVFYPIRGLPIDEALVALNLEKLNKVLDVYEAHLSKNKYLAGNFFSIADLSHLPYTHYLVNAAKRGDLISSRPHVQAWWDDISARPAWKKTLELAAKK